jgi:nicotinamidase/pyrazinamidase
MKSALIIVDIQNDFLPGGALAVPKGDEVINVANAVSPRFELVVATQDWHPPDHGSFAANHPEMKPGDVVDLDGLSQILWPVHCVRNTPGAAFADALDTSRVTRVFRKGTNPLVDSYSGFFDNARRQATGLGDFLTEQSVRDVYVLGLATDYCVKFTVFDAVELGFDTFVIEDGCRAVELQPGDGARALDDMRSAAAHVINSGDLQA